MDISFKAVCVPPEAAKKQRIYYLAEENINKSSKSLLFEKLRKNETALQRLRGKLESWSGFSNEFEDVLCENINVTNSNSKNPKDYSEKNNENKEKIPERSEILKNNEEKRSNLLENNVPLIEAEKTKENYTIGHNSNNNEKEMTKNIKNQNNRENGSLKVLKNNQIEDENVPNGRKKNVFNVNDIIHKNSNINEKEISKNINNNKNKEIESLNALKNKDNEEQNFANNEKQTVLNKDEIKGKLKNDYFQKFNVQEEKIKKLRKGSLSDIKGFLQEEEEIAKMAKNYAEKYKNSPPKSSRLPQRNYDGNSKITEQYKQYNSPIVLEINEKNDNMYSLGQCKSERNDKSKKPQENKDNQNFQKTVDEKNERKDQIYCLDDYSTEKTMNYLVTPEKPSSKPCMNNELHTVRKQHSKSQWDNRKTTKNNTERDLKAAKNKNSLANSQKQLKNSQTQKKSGKKVMKKEDFGKIRVENISPVRKNEWEWPEDRREKICSVLKDIDKKFRFLKAKLRKEAGSN